jgi:hypothetical protein
MHNSLNSKVKQFLQACDPSYWKGRQGDCSVKLASQKWEILSEKHTKSKKEKD